MKALARTRRLFALLSVVVVWFAAEALAQPQSLLHDMPSVAEVLHKVGGDDALETAANQTVVLHQLVLLIPRLFSVRALS